MREFTMPTTDEILERCRTNDDVFGFGLGLLASYLPFEMAREFLKPETTEADWPQTPLARSTVIAEMADYMEFAWEKAIDERGLSANRSIIKMQAWLFLLGDTELLAFAENDRNYPMYGKPILQRICEAYELPTPAEV